MTGRFSESEGDGELEWFGDCCDGGVIMNK